MKLIQLLIATISLFGATSGFGQTVRWSCEARGQVHAGPGGPVWEYILGDGRTQQEASMDALNKCRRRGMQLCTIQSCRRR